MSEPAAIPERGRSPADLLAAIDEMAAGDIDWRGGRAFSLVYNVDDEEHEHLLADVAGRFLHENALNPFKYPSLLQMELDLIAMACGLFGTAPDAGALTSGGTESIFLAVQVARDHARAQRGIPEPRLVTPTTAHPAFAKAAKYLDVEHVLVPVAADGRADAAATAAAIDDRTGLVVGSAPCYPYGVIDPIEELAALAQERSVLFHIDACLGGWLLPWWERLGEPGAAVGLPCAGRDVVVGRRAQVRLLVQGRVDRRSIAPGTCSGTNTSSTTTGPAGCTAPAPRPAPDRRRRSRERGRR